MSVLLEFQVPKIVQEDLGDKQATFVVEPLDRGFGHTYGNSLRRVLLSSIEGAAVTSVKIEGIAHEFTTIKGVREDVTDIILNLKELVCVLHGDSGEVEARVAKDGPGIVTAADIDAPSDLDIMNPELEICQLDKGARFEMLLTISRGRGYVAAEGNKGPETTIGVIPVDSIFSPVRRVAVHVDSARVGQRTDFDKLTLEVTTDGSITASEAVSQAATILVNQFAIFTKIDPKKVVEDARDGRSPGDPEPAQTHGMENILIEELELGVRSYNCLKRVGIETIGDLVSKTEQELAAIPNFGKKSIEEVRETLATHGLKLRGDD
jgi:DNA-directed RNA polymerase subunit alpha